MRPVDRIAFFRANETRSESRRPASEKTGRRGAKTDSPVPGVSAGSVVTLSQDIRVSAVARRAVAAAPTVRPERVAAARAAIAAGRYVVDPAEIAARMVAAVI